MKQKIAIRFFLIFTGIFAVSVVITVFQFATKKSSTIVAIGEPTNFAEVGTLLFPEASDYGQDIPYLSYVSAPGAPTTTVALSLDTESVCAASSGAVQCMAMSAQFSTAFAGKRAIVEGVEKEGKITVRTLRVLADGDPGLVPGLGLVYIPWPQAVALIEACKPKMILQTHNLNVSLTLSDEKIVHSVEPIIDEVFRVLERTRQTCGTIPVATE